MNYSEALDFLGSLKQEFIKFDLERMQKAVLLLGNPQDSFKSVHVAGTNGKGSVCAMLHSILLENGYSAGLYTSPHLVDVRERFMADAENISMEEFAEIASWLRLENERLSLGLSYFEFSTMLAFEFFRRRKVEFAVVETGMGGRLDATNVLTPKVSVVTAIGFEHQETLGRTIEKIASEKAGIVKEGVPAVLGEENEKVVRVFEQKCAEKNARLFIVPRNAMVERKFFGLHGQTFSFAGNGLELRDAKMPFAGRHQLLNASVALSAVAELQKQGFVFSEKGILRGIAKAKWQGRFQAEMRDGVTVILDGCHNPHGAKAFAETFMEIFPDRKAVFVIGISADKDIKKMAEIFAPLCEKAIVCSAGYHGAKMEVVAKALECNGVKIILAESVAGAVALGLNEAKGGVLCVAGSLYVVGEAFSALGLKTIRPG